MCIRDRFCADSNISVKIDGAPAIVWGTNPVNNKFFIGTKSVFNKKLIKINYNHTDIDRNHKGEVANILHICFDNLPDTSNIYQGDFIGFGGTNDFNPNTIRYIFPDKITQEIVIAPHTTYTTNGDLRDAIASPISDKELISLWQSAEDVHFVYPDVTIDYHRDNIHDLCKFARQIATLCDFPNDKQVKKITQQLNTCIRGRIDIDDITQEALAYDNNVDVNVYRLWKLVQSIKHDMFDLIERFDDVECYIDDEVCDHEGYVIVNECGTFKIIDREYFSCANFNRARY